MKNLENNSEKKRGRGRPRKVEVQQVEVPVKKIVHVVQKIAIK